jgi:hypothetical protein
MIIQPRPSTHPHVKFDSADVKHHDVRKCGSCIITMNNGDQYVAVHPDVIDTIKSLTPAKPRV